MAELEVFAYDEAIVETEDAIGIPIAVAQYDDIPSLDEAFGAITLIVISGDYAAAAIVLDGLFFLGCTKHGDMVKFIHTPAADAFFDEHYPGWRHGLNLPITLN